MFYIQKNIFHVVLLVIIFNIFNLQGSNGQETCVAASGTQGICISITQCNSLLNILRQSETLPASETGNLKKSFCGVEGTTPKVCCPNDNASQGGTSSRKSPSQIPEPPDVTRHRNIGLINSESCGPFTEVRVIGGNKTGVVEFPWMALIKYDINNKYQDFQCGGTIINKRYVLTAAHCVVGLRKGYQLHSVRLGEHDLDKERDCDYNAGVETICADKYQDFSIESFHVHGGYRTTRQDEDIALIRINRDADFRPRNVRPICLPVGNLATSSYPKGMIVTGWGRTESGFASQDLLKVTLDIANNDDCDRVWRESNGISVTYKQICAGGQTRLDSCAGDSGGPLQYANILNGTPKFVQYGIVSFGTASCGVIGYPGVYTKISYYMDWILDNMY